MQKSRFLDIQLLCSRCRQDEISVYAAQAAFFLILSVFPFLCLLLSLLQLFPAFSKQEILPALSCFLPSQLSPLFQAVFQELSQTTPAAFLSFSALTALWSSSRGTFGMARGFHRILGKKQSFRFFQQKIHSMLDTLAFLLVCLFTLSLIVFGSFLQNVLIQLFSLSSSLLPWLSVLRLTGSFLFLSGAFFLLYHSVLPASRRLPGALLASLGWMSSSICCSIYFQVSASFTHFYGQLASVALFMLWLYFCLWCLFLGAELNLSLSP